MQNLLIKQYLWIYTLLYQHLAVLLSNNAPCCISICSIFHYLQCALRLIDM